MKKFVLIAMTIVSVIVVLSNAVLCVLLFAKLDVTNNIEPYNTAVESCGLTMISMAICVWLGITIYNTLERNELAELKSTIEKYSPLSGQVREYTKKQLVNQIYKTGDKSCDYIAKCFEEDDEIPIERYADLLTIDILLQKTVEAKSIELRNQRIEWAEAGIGKIKWYRKKFKKRHNLEDYYLDYRQADFLFYKGETDDKKEKYASYKNAKDIYEKIMRETGLSGLDQDVFDGENIEVQKLSVYFANAIGQCYVNMMSASIDEKEEYEKLKINASKYLSFASKNSKKCLEREVYYRNYGCFIENNSCDINGLEKAYEMYKKALSVSLKEYRTYYVIISNLNKRLRYALNIEKRTPIHTRNTALKDMDFTKIGDREKVVGLINEMKTYIDVAIDIFPDKPEWYAFSVYRRLYKMCLEGINNSAKRKASLKLMKQDLMKVDILNGKGDLCKVVKLEVEDLENI